MLTRLRSDVQIAPCVTVNDQMAPGAALVTGADSLQSELNAIRSQIGRILSLQSQSWTSDVVSDGSGTKRGLNAIGSSLYSIESKPLLARASVQTSINVPASQNYVILSVAGGQAPSQTIAIALTQLGAVVAQSSLSAAAFAAHETTSIAGSSATSPRNFCRVRLPSTGQQLESNDRDVNALIAVESTATDGGTFNDTSGGARVKLSFVSEDGSGNLVAVPASVVGGQTIQYSYVLRQTFAQLPEQSFLGGSEFLDQAGDVDITVTRAVANQNGPVTVGKNLLWQLSNGFNFKVQDQGGAKDLISIQASPGANAVVFNPDGVTFNTTTPPASKKGIIAGQTAQAINLGVTTGQIDTAGPLTVTATGSNGLTLKGGTTTNFQDGYQAGSTWAATGINLSSSSADWTAYKAAVGGEFSLLAGIAALAAKTTRVKVEATVTQNIPAGTLITGYGTGANINKPLPDYSTLVSKIGTAVNFFYNGELIRIGTSAADNLDGYISGTPSKGELILNFPLRYSASSADYITVEAFGVPVT